MTTNSLTYPTRRRQLHFVLRIFRAIPFLIAFAFAFIGFILCFFALIVAFAIAVSVGACLLMVVLIPVAVLAVTMLIAGFLVPRFGVTYRGWARGFGHRIDAGADRLEKVADKIGDGIDRVFDGFCWVADRTIDRI